jgi:hypothetical protein
MTDLLENIDATLETLEEQLLDEFIRIRNIGTAQEFGVINPSIKNALSGILEELVKERQQSTLDGSGLSLLTERDENINARLKDAPWNKRFCKIEKARLHELHPGVQSSAKDCLATAQHRSMPRETR